MGDVQNILQFSDVLWGKIQPLMDEYSLVSMKIFQLNAQAKYDLADLYGRVKDKLEVEMTNFMEEYFK